MRKRQYKSAKYRNCKRQVFVRDSYTCQMCQKNKCKISAHHILVWSRFPEHRYDINNGISLCLRCHKSIFCHENEYKSLFYNFLEQSLIKRIKKIYEIHYR